MSMLVAGFCSGPTANGWTKEHGDNDHKAQRGTRASAPFESHRSDSLR